MASKEPLRYPLSLRKLINTKPAWGGKSAKVTQPLENGACAGTQAAPAALAKEVALAVRD